MFKSFLIICFALCSVSLVASRRHWLPPGVKTQATQVTYSPELLQDLRDFIDLIPSITIDELIAEHMIVDSGFRKAIKFLRSSEFKQLQQRAESLPEIIEVINFVHLNDTNISSLIRGRINMRRRQQLITNTYKSYGYDFIDVPAGSSIKEGVVVVLLPLETSDSEELGSFVSFTQELLTHLPRDRFVAMITEKCKSRNVFPKFYEAIRSDEFKQLLENTMKSKNVINIINTLGSHAIDAHTLKEIALEVISWGPTVTNSSFK